VSLRLPAGKSILTVHILTEGNMNLAISTSSPWPGPRGKSQK
jgi:hypothetical protein